VDASESSDIEDSVDKLKVRWNFKRDDGSDQWTAFSTTKTTKTPVYETAGIKTIQLEVRDRQGSKSILKKQVRVLQNNLPPHAFFIVSPENQHGISTMDIRLDAGNSYDSEDGQDIKVRWDFEDDGLWDTKYSHDFSLLHSYKFPRVNLDFGTTIVTSGDAQGAFILGNYAYVADGSLGLEIFDNRNPGAWNFVRRYDTPGQAHGVFVSGYAAYVADGSSGLQIVYISNPWDPFLAGMFDTPGEACGVVVSGNYAYVADGGSGLQIIDISNLMAPVLAGSYDTSGFASEVFVSGDYAYVADGASGLQIIDIHDPRVPVLAGSYDTPGFAYGVFVSGNYAYVTDGASGLQIIDINNPRAPVLVGTYDTPGNASKVLISRDYAYVADGASGLQVIDINNPRAPTLAGTYNRYNSPDGACGVLVSGNYVYLVTRNLGVQIMSVDTSAPAPRSLKWRIKAEVIDKSGYVSSATRDVWAINYNHPPLIKGLEFFNDQELKKFGPPIGEHFGLHLNMILAWAVGSTSNSNTITIVNDGMLLGNGVGQQDRVGAAGLAIRRAIDAGHEDQLNGAVAYSDSFFPFPDAVEVLADAGIKAIFSTSGSVRDKEVQDLCVARGIALYQLPDKKARGFLH